LNPAYLQQRLTGHLSRVLAYVDAFGALQGCALSRLTARRAPGITARIPGLPRPILLRPRTCDTSVFEQVFVRGDYDFDYPARPVRFVVDAGAHIGLASLFFARRFPEARIVALEPDRDNFGLLSANLAGYSQATALRAALWSKPARLWPANAGADSWALQFGDRPGVGEPVDGVTIPEVMCRFGVDRIDLLKLDIEGAELELFGDATPEWLDQVGMIAIELHDWVRPGCAAAFYGAFTGRPFRQFIKGDSLLVICDDWLG
jgi:FkbM family methyltransferase